MSDLEENEEIYQEETQGRSESEPEAVKKGKKGMRKSVPATPERLEILARAREKALEVRKANAAARGKGKEREEAKQKAEHNRKEADERFNKKVEEEIQKRMGKIHLDKINEVVDEKIKAKTPRKPKKKIIYEEESSSSEEEVIVRRRKPRKTIVEAAPEPAPAPEPKPPPVERQEPIQQKIDPFQNLLRTVPNAARRSNINPYYRPIR